MAPPPDDPVGTPDVWRSRADDLLSPPCCAFHRNTEITSRYAWLHLQRPTLWVHLAYLDGGIEALRRLLGADRYYAAVLAAFEVLDAGRTVLEDDRATPQERAEARERVWAGNLALLEHEQRSVVQPHFDRLSGAFGRLVSMGSTTTFEVRGLRRELRYFTSFYVSSFGTGFAVVVRTRRFPLMTRFEDRWRWLERSVVPRFRRWCADRGLVEQTLHRVVEESRRQAAHPCLVPS